MAPASDPFEVALRQLERRARTVFEVRKNLRGRGFSAAQTAGVISRLSGLGYLDDLAYAVRYAAWAAMEKPMGRRRVAHELMRRGIDRDTIDRALGSAFKDNEEAGALDRALKRSVRGARVPPDEKTLQRVTSYLLRRGFKAAQVMAAVRAWAEGSSGHRAAAGQAGEEFEE